MPGSPTWTGVGLIVTGMARQEYRLHLTNIEDGVWRATFSRSVGLVQDGVWGLTNTV